MASSSASPTFFQNIIPVVKSPDFTSWADEVEAASEAELGSQRQIEPALEPLDDGFTKVKNGRRRGGNASNNKPAPARGRSKPFTPFPDQQPWQRNQAAQRGSRGRGRGAGGPRPSTTTPALMDPQVILDPREVPPPPADLSADAKIVYNVIKANQPGGGCTCRKICMTLHATLNSNKPILRSNGSPFEHEDVGNLLWDELKAKHLVYKQGGQGGKWKILLK